MSLAVMLGFSLGSLSFKNCSLPKELNEFRQKLDKGSAMTNKNVYTHIFPKVSQTIYQILLTIAQ